jgi:hypothetical protein
MKMMGNTKEFNVESNAKPIDQDELTQAFLAAVVNNCVHLLKEGKLEPFNLEFEVQGKKYTLSLTDNEHEFCFLKDN